MNNLRILLSTTVLGALGLAALVITPKLHGGGGDEGVDLLPLIAGSSDAATAPTPSMSSAAPGVKRGAIYVHGSKCPVDLHGSMASTGVDCTAHSISDLLFAAKLGTRLPSDLSLDLATKGARALQSAETPVRDGAQMIPHLWLGGRFELKEVDGKGQAIELVSKRRQPAVVSLILGHRGTTTGAIRASFTSIDYVLVDNAPDGRVDLQQTRADAVAAFGGTGYDVGVGLLSSGDGSQTWAAFNVDDLSPRYDIETRPR